MVSVILPQVKKNYVHNIHIYTTNVNFTFSILFKLFFNTQGSLLVLSTLSSPTSMRSPKEKQFYMLMLVFCLVFPNILVFLKSLWRCAFKSFVKPNMRTMSFVRFSKAYSLIAEMVGKCLS